MYRATDEAQQGRGHHPRRPSTAVAPLHVPQRILREGVVLPDRHRDRGIHFVGASGSGKSLTLGYLAFFDRLRGVPQVVFDPLGQAIDAFLLRVAQFSKPIRRRLWPSIRYIDMSGRGTVVPRWPLLFGLPGDSRRDIADRFLETCRAIDAQLDAAPLLGANALLRVGTPVGIILSSLGLQLDQALDLLDRPDAWYDRLDECARRFPEARQAVGFFRQDYLSLKPGDRSMVSQSYRAKLLPILLDPALRAMLCTEPPSLDLDDVVGRRQTVLLDFRGVANPRARLLLTRWVYDTILAYIRHRGPGRHRPLALHFDEIVELAGQGSLADDRFSKDLDYLLNVLMRNSNLWVTAAHQQMWQLGEHTRETLLSMGTQLLGLVSDLETAEVLTRRFAGRIDPMRPKRMRNVWTTIQSVPYIIEKEPVDFPLDEQVFQAARAFLRLRPFEFFVKPRDQAHLQRASIAEAMGAPWPNEHAEVIEYIRYQLALREGRGAYTRLPERLLTQVAEARGTMEGYVYHDQHIDEEDIGDWTADLPR